MTENVDDVETFNGHMVGVQGDKIGMMMPPRGLMTRDEALVLAAWLVSLADPVGERFAAILDKVQST